MNPSAGFNVLQQFFVHLGSQGTKFLQSPAIRPNRKGIQKSLFFPPFERMRMSKKQTETDNSIPADEETGQGHGGKVENDTNKTGDQEPTQKNEGRRTPESRSDRVAHIGSGNHSQSRQGKSGGTSGGH